MTARPFTCLLIAAALLSACREKAVKEDAPPPPPNALSVPTLGRNLLVNGDAEAVLTVTKPGSKSMQNDVPADWEVLGDTSVTEYGRAADEWPDAKAGCEDGRKRYFRLALALNEANETLRQFVPVAGSEAEIDAGQVECALGGWFGGWVSGDASAKLEVDFLGAGDRKLGTLATEPPDPNALPKPANGRAALIKALAAGPVPSGTRRLDVRLMAVRMTEKVDTNAVATADNLSIVLRKKEK